jgi:hypothetical protein
MNSFLASSDLVVIGSLPPSDDAETASFPVLLQAIHERTLNASIAANPNRIDGFRHIGISFEDELLEDQGIRSRSV